MLKRARFLPIFALVKATFKITKTWFVERGFKIDIMLRRSLLSRSYHNLNRKIQQDSAMCFVGRFNANNSKFDVQELVTPNMVDHLRHIQL